MTVRKDKMRNARQTELNEFEQEAVERLKNGDKLSGKDGILAPLIKRIVEASLEGELESHLQDSKEAGLPNRRNGNGQKKLKTEYGEIDLETRRDRAGTFEPEIVPKRQGVLGKGLDDKIISLYTKGTSYQDIREHLEDLYGLEISKAKISAITDQVLPAMHAWRGRTLEAVYPIVWMDCIHYKIREKGRTVSRAIYVILGINCEGEKDLLGLYASENEGANFWLGILADLQNRGVKDCLLYTSPSPRD